MSAKKTLQDKVVHAIIASQLALNLNEDLRYSIPKIYKQNFKHLTNRYLQSLIKNEKDFDLLFDKEETSLIQVYDVMEEHLKTIAKIPIWEMENFKIIAEAYLKDPKSLQELSSKILNQPIKKDVNGN